MRLNPDHAPSTVPTDAHLRAMSAFTGLAALRVSTINHRNAGLAALQDLSLDARAAADLHRALSRQEIESIVLATCNRTELYWRAQGPGDDDKAHAEFARALEVGDGTLQDTTSALGGEAAALHLFRVCCGIESLVLGEAEILGQVRSARDACAPFIEPSPPLH